MSLLKPLNKCTVCYRVANPNVLQYANQKRNNGSFNDVIIQTNFGTISANRMILSCCSRFFEAMFDSEMKEKYQNPVQIHEVDGAAVKLVIDFMYSGEVKITSENVMKLIAASDYLQVAEVKRFCFEFLESILSSDNWFAVYNAAKIYESEHLQNQTYDYVSNNFDDVVQTDEFKFLSQHDLTLFVSKINRHQIKEESIFYGITTWCRINEVARKEEFPLLFEELIDLYKISVTNLENILLNEEYVAKSTHCLKLMTNHLCQRRANLDKTKVISLGGALSLRNCIEIYSASAKSHKKFTDLPLDICGHCYLSTSDFVYLIGGNNSAVQIKNTVTPFLLILSFYNQCMPQMYLHLFPKFDEKIPQNNKSSPQ